MDARRPTTTSRVIALISDHRAEIVTLCDRYGVVALDVFGSSATGAFDEDTSDVDFIVRFADTSPGLANR